MEVAAEELVLVQDEEEIKETTQVPDLQEIVSALLVEKR